MALYPLTSKPVFEFLLDYVIISFQGMEKASLSLLMLLQWLRSGNALHPDNCQSRG